MRNLQKDLKEKNEKIESLTAIVQELSQMTVPKEEKEFTIKVNTIDGPVYPKVMASDTVLTLKAKIQEAKDLPINEQRLIFRAKQLEDGRTLGSYGIEQTVGAQITCAHRLQGGMGVKRKAEVPTAMAVHPLDHAFVKKLLEDFSETPFNFPPDYRGFQPPGALGHQGGLQACRHRAHRQGHLRHPADREERQGSWLLFKRRWAPIKKAQI